MSTIAERAASLFTWGRVAFLVVIGMGGFATFIAGEVSGARTLEPRVTALEARAERVDARMSIHAETLAEIRGYVRAIADRVGAKP